MGLEGIELDTFAPADISRIVEVQNVNRALYKDIRSTLNNLVQFINKPPQALQLIKMEAPKWVIGGTILGLMGKSGSSSINSVSHPWTQLTVYCSLLGGSRAVGERSEHPGMYRRPF